MLDSSSPPSWLRPASLRWVDASAEYYGLAARRFPALRAGVARTPEWAQAWSDVVHSQRTLQALREAGVTALTIHFDDGFGPRAQEEDFRHAAEFAARCHEYGFRVFARIEAGALFPEALLAERPDLATCAQRSAEGRLVGLGRGLAAWRPCYLSRGFHELLKESITIACDQVRADGVVLANVGPHLCHCERCQTAFRRLLASRHPDPRRTLGLPSVEHVRLRDRRPAADPVALETARFRVQAVRTALAEARIHLRSRSAHMALWAELPAWPGAISGTALWELGAPVDLLTCDADEGDGLAAQAHAYLAGNATRTLICLRSAPPTAADAALALGGHVLANAGALTDAGPPRGTSPRFLGDDAEERAWRARLDFAGRHEHYHHRARSIAEIAVALSASDVGAPTAERTRLRDAESALLEGCLPFDVLPMDALASGRYRVLVLAGQTRVTDEEAESISALVSAGHGLVLVGDAGARDACGRRRRLSAFAPLLGLSRVRHVPITDRRSTEEERTALQHAVAALLPPTRVVEVLRPDHATGGVIVHPFRLPTGQTTLHLLNTGGEPVSGLRLRVRADLAPTRHVAWHEPEAADRMLDCAAEGDAVLTALPPLHGQALVVTS